MRLEMLQRVARDEGVPLAYVNLAGANDELIFDGHSVVLNKHGEPLALGRGFAEDLVVVDWDTGSPTPKIDWPGAGTTVVRRAFPGDPGLCRQMRFQIGHYRTFRWD